MLDLCCCIVMVHKVRRMIMLDLCCCIVMVHKVRRMIMLDLCCCIVMVHKVRWMIMLDLCCCIVKVHKVRRMIMLDLCCYIVMTHKVRRMIILDQYLRGGNELFAIRCKWLLNMWVEKRMSLLFHAAMLHDTSKQIANLVFNLTATLFCSLWAHQGCTDRGTTVKCQQWIKSVSL